MDKMFHLYDASEKGLNLDLMNRAHDKPVEEYIANICKSLEVIPHIDFLGYDIETDETRIDITPYIKAKKRNPDKVNTLYKLMRDTRYSEITLKFRLSCCDGITTLEKQLLIPKVDENGYLTIGGKKYILLYQLVDKSTYTRQSSIIIKSFMSVEIQRESRTFEDIDGNSYQGPIYNILIYGKPIQVFTIYFAKMGLFDTLRYFSSNNIIHLTDHVDDNDKDRYMYFKVNSNLYIKVVDTFFKKYNYTRSMVFMLLENLNNRHKLSNIEDKRQWVEKLGMSKNSSQYKVYEKGINLLMAFNRMIDVTSLDILMMHPENKKDVYSVIRTYIQNYTKVRNKSVMDLSNKRLRLNEYVASVLHFEFNTRLMRIINSNRVTLDELSNLFKFSGDLIVKSLHSSGLLRYDDAVNDCDFFTKLKCTIKGPNSLGGKNERNIANYIRDIDVSYAGRFDINVCGNSDPGTSTVITPYCNDMHGMYFSNENEPEDFRFNFEKHINDYYNNIDSDSYIGIKCETADEYYDKLAEFKKMFDRIKMTETYHLDEDAILIDIRVDDDINI